MRVILGVFGVLTLAGCGGGSTTGTNYSDAPPMAEIVGTPTPQASETPESVLANLMVTANEAVEETSDNAVNAM